MFPRFGEPRHFATLMEITLSLKYLDVKFSFVRADNSEDA
jgi:hypothetical protein